jgi:hypothetical protein
MDVTLKRLLRRPSDETYCSHCRNEVDRTVCHCGTEAEHHGSAWDGHSFCAMGCTCGYNYDYFLKNGLVRRILNLPKEFN